MRLRELFEDRKKKVVAVMPGGFHPFHPGHKSLYDWAVKTFGQGNVYVAATDDTKSRPFPFNIKQQLASMAGVPKERFIQVKSPFNALSYQSLLNDAENTALVFVRSDKDQASHPKPDQIRKSDGQMGYIISYDGNLEHGADMHGYMTYGPTQDFNFSGLAIRSASELRAAWPEMGDEDKLQAANLMYPGKGEEASKMLDTALGINDAVAAEDVSNEELDFGKMWSNFMSGPQDNFPRYIKFARKKMFYLPDDGIRKQLKIKFPSITPVDIERVIKKVQELRAK